MCHKQQLGTWPLGIQKSIMPKCQVKSMPRILVGDREALVPLATEPAIVQEWIWKISRASLNGCREKQLDVFLIKLVCTQDGQ